MDLFLITKLTQKQHKHFYYNIFSRHFRDRRRPFTNSVQYTLRCTLITFIRIMFSLTCFVAEECNVSSMLQITASKISSPLNDTVRRGCNLSKETRRNLQYYN